MFRGYFFHSTSFNPAPSFTTATSFIEAIVWILRLYNRRDKKRGVPIDYRHTPFIITWFWRLWTRAI